MSLLYAIPLDIFAFIGKLAIKRMLASVIEHDRPGLPSYINDRKILPSLGIWGHDAQGFKSVCRLGLFRQVTT